MVNDKSSYIPLTFGFDIGIASVGWAVLAPDRIVALGVRAFDKAETAKEGDSLNLVRREARLVRRRLRRRAWRLVKLARVLKRYGVISDVGLFKPQNRFSSSLWHLRVQTLERCLYREEWARVLYHICKHRGFHWTSRAEEKSAEEGAKGESGMVKQGLAGTAKLMRDKGYRTAAEMVVAEFPDAQRNKQGDYSKALARKLLGDELVLLFRRQRELSNPFATSELEVELLGTGDHKSGLFWSQKPALAGADLLKMLGKCTFEKTEFRAPKASYSAERHVWLTRLNNLRIFVDGKSRPLSVEEHRLVSPMPYQQVGDLTYKQLRNALLKLGLPDSFRYLGLSYPITLESGERKQKDPEGAVLIKMPAWQALRHTLKKAGLETEWESMAGAAIDGFPDRLDQIAWVLSVYKDDDEVAAELRQLSLPNSVKMVEALLDLRFDKFHALSLKALRNIVPHMEAGLRYDEACANAGYHHSQEFKRGAGTHKTLPPLYKGRDKDGLMVLDKDADLPCNPVVLRALNQARKVLNALVKNYGSPSEVHIEMARDLSRPLDERRKIEKEQAQYRERNESDKARFAEHFGRPSTGVEFEKWRLYREQQCKCGYSLVPLDLHRLLEAGYCEVDHALPYSRSYDDSKNNKVLVVANENRNKGNRTPYEYLGGAEDSERWRLFVAFVESNQAYRQAKRSRLLRKNFGAEDTKEFRDRNLYDTRYVCRFFKNYVEQYLQLADGSEAKPCVVVSGQLTAFLRARWGLLKIREENDRHHALDAVVVAACTNGMVKRLSDYSRRKELEHARAGFIDLQTGEVVDPDVFTQLERHFPAPWPNFRHEIKARLNFDEVEALRAEIDRLGTYPADALAAVRPLFVSRAPQRRTGGAAHKDTIYSQSQVQKEQGSVTQKIPLASLALKDLDKLIDPHRNEKLYAAIRARLDAHGGNGDKAFPPDNPLRKPGRDGEPSGPIVRTVTILIKKLSGIPVRGGIAKNDTMLRVDVFRSKSDSKFHLVPVYVYHRVNGLPNRAIVAFKDENEWTQIDDRFSFCFSLYPNDLVCVRQKGKPAILGYFASCHRGTGNINIWTHDRARQTGNEGQYEGIGVKTALSLEKLHVDALGSIFPGEPETRRGLA